ncbi:hypothetical protein MMC16_007229 [Acarospora aff. strigata]|nr:hypothetical protein [Acarospora aff. strigata]
MNELLEKLHHFIAPTLPHLLALLLHPSKNTPPEKTGLIVVDAVSTLFATAFPRATDDLGGKQTMGKLKDTKLWAANRRSSVMGDLVSKLSKVAVTRNIAILLLNQTNTKVRADTGALLRPAISGPIWEAGISCRIVLFRDWPLYRASIERQEVVDQVEEVRYAGVLKAGGIVYGDSEGVGKVVAFAITDGGLRELESVSLGGDQGSLPILPGPSLKRKRDEIADSQSEDEELGSDEEFGWMDDDIVAGEGFTKKNDNTDDEGAGSADING